jgi:diketogulonate reductase-like aldo/keto reductase
VCLLNRVHHWFPDSTLAAFDSSLSSWDWSTSICTAPLAASRPRLYVETYRALERLYADGRVRAIGVSNFQQEHLERSWPRPRWCPR